MRRHGKGRPGKRAANPQQNQFHGTPHCPDCGAVLKTDGDFTHSPTCPLDKQVQAVHAGDERYFSEHPGERSRTRPITRAEREAFYAAAGVRPSGMVTVCRTNSGRLLWRAAGVLVVSL